MHEHHARAVSKEPVIFEEDMFQSVMAGLPLPASMGPEYEDDAGLLALERSRTKGGGRGEGRGRARGRGRGGRVAAPVAAPAAANPKRMPARRRRRNRSSSVSTSFETACNVGATCQPGHSPNRH